MSQGAVGGSPVGGFAVGGGLPAGNSIDFTGHGFSQRAFGTPLVGGEIGPTGFTRRAFGTPQVNFDINLSGFTRRAFGSPEVAGGLSVDGFTRRGFGSPQINFDIKPTGFTRRAFGAFTVEDRELHVSGFTRRAFGTPTFREQISFSGFTRRAFGTPTFSANTQVDFFLRGINRRAFGTPAVQGGDQRLSCYIQGVQRAAYLQVETATISKQIQTTGTAQMHLIIPCSASFRPDLGMSVLIQEFGMRKFGGIIGDTDEHLFPGADTFDFTVDCLDWNYIFDRHVVAQAFDPGYLIDHISAILRTPSFIADGLSLAGVDPTIFVAERMDFTDIKSMREVCNQFALSTNTVWWIDDFKVINFISIANARTSSFSISDDGKQVDTIHLRKSLKNYRNTQYIRSTSNILTKSITITDSHTFDGTDQVCPTTYPLTSEPASVLENGVEIVGTSRLFELKLSGPTAYPPSGSGWYWIQGDFGVWYWPSFVRPAAATTLAVRYTGIQTPRSNIVVYKDLVEILAMASATGGSGNFEDVVDFSGSATYDELVTYAQGLVQATAPVPSEFTCNTIEQIEGLGYKVPVSLTKYGLNTSYVIQSYTASAKATDLGKGSHFVSSLVLVSAKTLGDWRSYWERVLARLHAISAAQPTLNPTWSLAFDAGDNISPGLTRGPFGSPWPVTVNTATILGVSVLFQDAPDTDIILDVFKNGISILDSAKIKYVAANSPNQIIFANLVITNCKQGDVFSGQILSTGVITPGKNGVVTVILSAR